MALYLFNAKKNSLPWESLPETIQKVITDTFNITPKYAIRKISKYNNGSYVIHFTNNGSFSIDISHIDIIKKHNISIQVPGNQNYLWSLSISE